MFLLVMGALIGGLGNMQAASSSSNSLFSEDINSFSNEKIEEKLSNLRLFLEKNKKKLEEEQQKSSLFPSETQKRIYETELFIHCLQTSKTVNAIKVHLASKPQFKFVNLDEIRDLHDAIVQQKEELAQCAPHGFFITQITQPLDELSALIGTLAKREDLDRAKNTLDNLAKPSDKNQAWQKKRSMAPVTQADALALQKQITEVQKALENCLTNQEFEQIITNPVFELTTRSKSLATQGLLSIQQKALDNIRTPNDDTPHKIWERPIAPAEVDTIKKIIQEKEAALQNCATQADFALVAQKISDLKALRDTLATQSQLNEVRKKLDSLKQQEHVTPEQIRDLEEAIMGEIEKEIFEIPKSAVQEKISVLENNTQNSAQLIKALKDFNQKREQEQTKIRNLETENKTMRFGLSALTGMMIPLFYKSFQPEVSNITKTVGSAIYNAPITSSLLTTLNSYPRATSLMTIGLGGGLIAQNYHSTQENKSLSSSIIGGTIAGIGVANLIDSPELRKIVLIGGTSAWAANYVYHQLHPQAPIV